VIQLLALALRAALVLFFVRLFLRFVAAVVRGYKGESPSRPDALPRGGDLVRDRVCNTFVPRSRALEARVDGETQYFCSPACRDSALGSTRRAS
jgi:hypothetical protein